MNTNNKRNEKYKKDEISENVFELMNKTLYPKEIELIQKFNIPEKPLIFIIGAQRSGTTLLMQLITQFFDVSYPNNFIARYWDAPYIGAMLYKNLSGNIDNNTLDFNSDLGYTKGLKGPHEFGYFWKKWFPWKSWEEKNYSEIDYSILQKQLAAWESVNNTPLVFKNIIDVSFNIEKLSEIFPHTFFIHIKRKPEFVVQSTYQSRIKLFGSPKIWIGLKPPEYNKIKKLPVFEQICAQIYYSVKHIELSLSKTKVNSLTVNYEDIIINTKDIMRKIKESLNLKSSNIEVPILNNTNKIRLPEEDFDNIKTICKNYFN